MGSVPMPSLNVSTAQDVAQRLFEDIFVNDAYSRLIDLEVRFKHRRVYDRAQSEPVRCSVRVRRYVRDDAPSPAKGGFTVECDGKWIADRGN